MKLSDKGRWMHSISSKPQPTILQLAQGSKRSIPRGRMCYETAFEDVLGKRGVGCCHAICGLSTITTRSERFKNYFTLPTGSKK